MFAAPAVLLKCKTLHLDWPLLHEIEDDEILMTMLAMICPFLLRKSKLFLKPRVVIAALIFYVLVEMSVRHGHDGCLGLPIKHPSITFDKAIEVDKLQP